MLSAVAIVLVFCTAAFFAFAPAVVDKRFNPVVGTSYQPGDVAQALHDSLVVVDLHGDQMLWDRNVLTRVDRGHVDLPRLRDGNVAIQVFSAVTKSPKGQNYDSNTGDTDRLTALMVGQLRPARTWRDVNERALHQAQRLRAAAARSQGNLVIIESLQDLESLLERRASGAGVVGAVLAMEGMHDLRGEQSRFQALVDAGYRMMSFVHFFDNDLGGSAHGVGKGGLTPAGREVMQEMAKTNVVMDLAHVSEASINEILDAFPRPVVVSHTGVKGTCPGVRNLSDSTLFRMKENGGVVGIGYWAGAVCGTEPSDIAAAARYVADLIGVEHVALGSDFDGSVATAFDASGHVLVTSALLDAGFSSTEVGLIMGGNAIRVLRQNL